MRLLREEVAAIAVVADAIEEWVGGRDLKSRAMAFIDLHPEARDIVEELMMALGFAPRMSDHVVLWCAPTFCGGLCTVERDHTTEAPAAPQNGSLVPYYADEWTTLYRGDAIAAMSALDTASVDIVVTSPPYNMGVTPGGNGRGLYRHSTQKATRFGDRYSEVGDDSMDPAEYEAWLLDALDGMLHCARHAVFLNHRPRIIHGQATPPIDPASLNRRLAAAGAQLRQVITWDRGTGIDVNLNHFCTRGEWIMVLAKPTFRLVDHAASGMGDVWRMPIVTGSDHPAPFPVELPARCIAATGADSVLDPFAGSGTTLVAAKRVGVRSVGIEKSERYCEMAAERLASTPVSMFVEAEPATQEVMFS